MNLFLAFTLLYLTYADRQVIHALEREIAALASLDQLKEVTEGT
jgi:hypothetical protein